MTRMSVTARSLWMVLVVGAASFSPAAMPLRASAQEDCERPPLRKPLEITPSSGAAGVTIDAPITVLYSEGYFGPDGPGDPPDSLFSMERCAEAGCAQTGCELGDGSPVQGQVEVLGDRLFFVPDGGLRPGFRYVGRADGVEGVIDFSFCTGSQTDMSPPTTPSFLHAEPAPTGPSCRLPDGGRRVGLRYSQSTDDGPPGSIEYLLYLTRGHGVEAPELRDRLRNFAAPQGVTLSLLLTADESAEPVCVRLFAIDGVGNLSDPSNEVCVDPLTSVAFQPLCSIRGPGTRSGLALLMMLGVLAWIALRRRP